MKIKLDKGAFVPERGHDTDAGLDLRAKDSGVVFPHDGTLFETGVHIKLPIGTAGLLVSKSGLSTKHGITSTGLIDEGYSGEIKVMLFNHTNQPYLVDAGDKITQLVIIPVKYETVQIVDDLEMDSDRGTDGFGSTGR